MNIRQINEEIQKVLKENCETTNLEFIETGYGYLQVYEKPQDDNSDNKLLFEIEYNDDEEYLCISDCTKDKSTIYYIDTNEDINPYDLVSDIKTINSYEEMTKLIKNNHGYTVDYDIFGKEIRTYL